jgi:hypothetical protein
MTSAIDLAKDLFCGCMSGWGQVISMLPFENIKVKVISKPEEYNQGYLHAVKKTIQEEGLLSLYKGMLFPLLGVGAQVSVQFGFVETLKKLMKTKYADSEGNLHYRYSFYSGLLCGLPSALIVVTTPLPRLPSTTPGSKSPSTRRREWAQSRWPPSSSRSMDSGSSTSVSSPPSSGRRSAWASTSESTTQ